MFNHNRTKFFIDKNFLKKGCQVVKTPMYKGITTFLEVVKVVRRLSAVDSGYQRP